MNTIRSNTPGGLLVRPYVRRNKTDANDAKGIVEASHNPSIYSAWLGITPREYSSGDKRYLGRITKKGDKCLRTLLIHGARSVMARNKIRLRENEKRTGLQQWAIQLEQRVGHNKAKVALANKMVRILWATWMHQREFDGNYALA